MHPDETPRYFSDLLRESGFDESKPDNRLVWETFKIFAASPCECDESEVIFSLGCESDDNPDQTAFPNGLGFLELCRDFAFDEEGHRVHRQLIAYFRTGSQLRPRLGDVGISSKAHQTLASFFEAIEEIREFKTILSRPDLCFLGSGPG